MNAAVQGFLFSGIGAATVAGLLIAGWNFITSNLSIFRKNQKIDSVEKEKRDMVNKRVAKRTRDIAAAVKLIKTNNAIEKEQVERINTIVSTAAAEIDATLTKTSLQDAVRNIDEAFID